MLSENEQIDPADITTPYGSTGHGGNIGTKYDRYMGTYDPHANGRPGHGSGSRATEHARLYGFSAGAAPQYPGAGSKYTGFYLHEVMVFNELLTIDKINQIGKHLAAKWIGNGDDSAWLQIKQ